MENIEILTEKRQKLFEQLNEVKNNYKDIISKLVEQSLGENWSCVTLSISSLELGFVNGTWKNGNPRYQSFDIYFDPNHCDYDFTTHSSGAPYFKFEINTCCFGSFNIKGESTQKTYYIGVGKLLSDTSLHESLIETLKKFYEEYGKVSKEINVIEISINSIKNAEEKIKKQKEEAELFEKQKEIIKNISGNLPKYVVVFKGSTENNNYVYRNEPVRWYETDVYDYKGQADYIAKRQNRYVIEGKYVVVDITKLKFA